MSKSTHTQPTATTPTPANNAQAMLQLWQWFLPTNLLSAITFHGNIGWRPDQLVIQAFLWTWSNSQALTDAFDEATQQCRTLLATAAVSTYQGFMAALVQWSPLLLTELLAALRWHAQQIGGPFWKVGQWVPIAFDGSRSATPRTRSNQTAYHPTNYGKGPTAKYRKKKIQGRYWRNKKSKPQPPQPQVWITLLWHMGLRLPWAWRLGPSNTSERDDVLTMLSEEDFPNKTIFCGDAGFIGYPLWSKILEEGHDFLVRVGANVHLLVESLNCTVVTKGRQQFVWCWPQDAQREGWPPLRLRLVRIRVKKARMWLLTSVLDSQKLTPWEVASLYRMRWGIEVEFRGLKQTLDRAELRCRNESRVRVELDWSILGMAVAELWALKEQLNKAAQVPPPRKYTPAKRSLAETVRALRWCLRNLREGNEPGASLRDRLAEAVTDDYKRQSSKRARYRPVNPDKKSLGDPKLRPMTTEEKEKLHDYTLNLAA
jgi:hypothetical protein